MSVVIRDALLSDLPTIVDIYNSSIGGRMATADTSAIPVESREPWFKEHRPEFRPLWIATLNDSVVGWLSFQSFYGRPAYDRTAEISVYVSPLHQGQGIGRTLLTNAIDRGPGFGLRTLLGFIFGHNEPSLRLFYSLGFSEWGLLPRVALLDDIERDLIIVGRRLSG
jgi:L-amino acid N-acyltransferase YncA